MICDKLIYRNKTEAREAIQGIADETGDKLYQYKCKECGGIHLATRDKGHIRNINRIGGEKFRYVELLPEKFTKKKKK